MTRHTTLHLAAGLLIATPVLLILFAEDKGIGIFLLIIAVLAARIMTIGTGRPGRAGDD